MRSIVYLTDNTLAPGIMALCQRKLLEVAGDIPIISISQRPIDFGHNINVGEIGRNWLSLYKQLLAGCRAADTEWVVIAEHDCLYTAEHLNYTPEDGGVFWYNDNRWLVQWGDNHPELNGMYSKWSGSLALSQLISNRELLAECIAERVKILDGGNARMLGKAEPGITVQRARKWARSGKPIWLRKYLAEHLNKYEHRVFNTELPNLDIRHGSNFTGPKRGKRRRYELPYWGTWEDWRDG